MMAQRQKGCPEGPNIVTNSSLPNWSSAFVACPFLPATQVEYNVLLQYIRKQSHCHYAVQVGNSVSVPVVQAIAECIINELERLKWI